MWESSIKLVKNHLKRIVGNTKLTFSEYVTVLTQIEAYINSRPLFPLSSDPNDLSVLTPAHFLTGSSLLDTPETDIRHLPVNRLTRWQHVTQICQHFWKRWTREYLQELQGRNKWTTSRESISPGTLVLVKDDQTPPLSWIIARVERTYPGPDGKVRVADLRTKAGVLKRNIRSLCPLPVDDEDSLLKPTLQGGEHGKA